MTPPPLPPEREQGGVLPPKKLAEIAKRDRDVPKGFSGPCCVEVLDRRLLLAHATALARQLQEAEAPKEVHFNQGQNHALRIVGDRLGLAVPTHTAVGEEIDRLLALARRVEAAEQVTERWCRAYLDRNNEANRMVMEKWAAEWRANKEPEHGKAASEA